MIIIGAGLSGCLAAMLNPEAGILEAGAGKTEHQAVLRFSQPQIGRAVGIPFRAVQVWKSVWAAERHWHEPDPRWMNLYSRKVTNGHIHARSLRELHPVTRWIAPHDLHSQLLQRLGNRVHFNAQVTRLTREQLRIAEHDVDRNGEPVLSTIPLPQLLKVCDIQHSQEFEYSPVHVTRWTIPNCAVYQTVYFPELGLPLYRATLTGDALIAEAMESVVPEDLWRLLERVFGLNGLTPQLQLQHTQRYGKILPVDAAWRKRTLYHLTSQFNVYSLGRFALWSNLLLDDVYDDLSKVRAMMALTTDYDLLKAHTQETIE